MDYNDRLVRWTLVMPPNSVITNAWLGSTNEVDAPGYKQYTARISTKSAARTVFENQVKRSRDPALIEQLSPTWYEVSVYPIPSLYQEYRQHFWIEFLTAADQVNELTAYLRYGGQKYPVPTLIEAKVGSWPEAPCVRDASTIRTLQGQRYEVPPNVVDRGTWIVAPGHPVQVPDRGITAPPSVSAMRACFRMPDRSLLTAVSRAADPQEMYQSTSDPGSVRFDMVLDSSLSMETSTSTIYQQFWNALEQQVHGVGVLASSKLMNRAPEIITPGNRFRVSRYLGSLSLREMLAQYRQAVEPARRAPSLIVWTDDELLGDPMGYYANPVPPLWPETEGPMPAIWIVSSSGSSPST